MYFNKNDYIEDFSAGFIMEAHLFVHEMVHVWQKHLGYRVLVKGMKTHIRSKDPYPYEISPSSRLQDYNMEQQGDIIADYFLLLNSEPKYMSDSGRKASGEAIRKVLSEFILNPKNKSLLPRTTRTRAAGTISNS
jgi:hypothetical protein